MNIEKINSMKNLDEFKYTTYLIGAMEKTAEGDSGESKRVKIFNGLVKRNVFPIDPTRTEVLRTGFTSNELKEKIEGWTASGNKELIKKYANYIWNGRNIVTDDYNLIYIPGDWHAVKISNWITCAISETDHCCVDKNTSVLMWNGDLKKIKDLKINEFIVGFKKIKNKTLMTKSRVLGVYNKGYKSTIQILDKHKNKLFLTPDHEVLTRNKKHGSIYSPANKITNGFSVKITHQSKAFYRGWVSGYFSHDGHIAMNWRKHEITALTDKRAELEIVKKILKKIGIKSHIIQKKQNNSWYYLISISDTNNFYKLYDLIKNPHPSKEFACGWISGSIDADGWYDKRSIRYSQSAVNNNHVVLFESYLSLLNIHYSKHRREKRTIYIKARKLNSNADINISIPKQYAFSIPSQLKYKRDKLTMTINKLNTPITTTLSYKRNVYDISTTTGNFVANGFIIHNCGTFGEAGIATDLKIPIYLITEMAKYKIPASFRQWISINDGKVFHSEHEYFKFIDEKYNLKEEK